MTTDGDDGWPRGVLHLFWNPGQKRIRALWRILWAVLGVLILTGIVNAVVIRPLKFPMAVVTLLSNGVPVVLTLVVVVLWARYVDKRHIRAYGFRLDGRWWRLLGLGVGVGVVGWGGALTTDIAFGWATVTALLSPGTGELPFGVSLLLFAIGWMFVAVWEETLFRGILMRNAIEGLNLSAVSFRVALVAGWVVSSVVFGVLHLNQATTAVALVFWILAGLILGLAYLLTDELAYPICLHFAFDVSFNNLYGLSSLRPIGSDIPTLVRPAFTGPELFVGLSGVVNTVWLLIIGGLTLVAIKAQYGTLEPRIEPYSNGSE